MVAHASGKKTYIIQYRLDGRSHRFALGEHGRLTPDQARKLAKQKLGDVASHKNPVAEARELRKAERAKRTFRQLSDDFMRVHVALKRKDSTASDYRGLLDRHILPAFGSVRVDELGRAEVARLHTSLSKRPYQANRCLALISAIWNWAAKRDQLNFVDNPAKGIERYKEGKRERYLSTAELARLGDALRQAETIGFAWETDRLGKKAKHIPKASRRTKVDPYAVAALRLLLFTGARLREILDARWREVDFERSLMLLPDSKSGQKTIYLNTPALSVLAALSVQKGNPYIIPGAKSGEARADLKKPWAALTRAAKLDGLRIHDLRHSFASVGVGAAGKGLPIIGKLLGHTQVATTARYAHLAADPMHEAANAIGARIAAAMGDKRADMVVSLTRA